jgi:hypothetical protein
MLPGEQDADGQNDGEDKIAVVFVHVAFAVGRGASRSGGSAFVILSEGFQRCLGPRRLVDLGQRPLKVLGNLGEAPLYRACPSDQDIIVAWDRVPRGDDSDRLL